MSIAMDSLSPNIEDLGLTERELFSLYVRYPEMDFDYDEDEELSNKDSEQVEEFLSSPATSSARVSGSTTQTTPLRPDVHVTRTEEQDEFQLFQSQLRDSELPNLSVIYLNGLASGMLQLGGILFPTRDDLFGPDDVQGLLRLSQELTSLLKSSSHRVDEQIANIAYVQTRAPFNVNPGPEDSWCNYRQMTELVVRHTQIPSESESNLLESLARIYDAYAYNPALVLSRTVEFNADVFKSLNDLYDDLMTLLEKYRRWCKAMKDLKRRLITRLRDVLAHEGNGRADRPDQTCANAVAHH